MPLPDLSIPLAETAIRATIVLAGAVVAAMVLRHGAASARHALWTSTTIALLSLPLLQGVLPTIPLPWLPAEASPATTTIAVAPLEFDAVVSTPSAPIELVTQPISGTVETATESTPMAIGGLITLGWLLGLLALAIPLGIGHRRARRLIRGATSCHDGRLLLRFSVAAELVGVRRTVALLLSADVRTPMTGGVVRPVVLLPAAALHWSDERLDTVLRHELVHVRRRDALRQLASRFSTALYWFHPLAWRANREAARAREQACDEAVLALGTRPSQYARHLLELADPVATPVPLPALVRLDHPYLEERVMAILRAAPAPASRRQTFFTTLGVAAWTLCVAAAGPVTAQAPRPPVAPEAPAAPSVPVAMAAPAPALPPSAPAAPGFDPEEAAPMALPALPALAPLPTAPAVPALPEPGRYDCEADGRAYRTGGSDRNVPVRMHTSTIDGIRICVAVRGRIDESERLVPTGRLPVGVTVTLVSAGADGEQRLEIAGTANSNTQTWTVNGRERPFDAAAAEWRDAMIALAQASWEKSRIRGDEARMRGEIARARGEDARLQGEMARMQARQAAIEARAISERVAPRAERSADVRAAAEARLAEVEKRQAQREQVIRQRVEAAQVEMQARQAALEARQSVLVERQDAGEPNAERRREIEREMALAERAMQREHQRLEQDLERMHREMNAIHEREVRMARQMVEQAELQEVRAAEIRERQRVARAEGAEFDADARIREIEERRRDANVAGRVSATEQRIQELQADRRVAEIETRMESLGARLRAAIGKL